MKKKALVSISIATLALVMIIFVGGCTKKQVVAQKPEQPPVMEEQAAALEQSGAVIETADQAALARAENERLATEQAEKERLAKERARQAELDRAAAQEKERLAEQQAEKERLAKEQARQAELDQITAEEKAERERLRKEREQREQVAQQAAVSKSTLVKDEAALADIHFDFDEYSIRADARDALQRDAEWLMKHPFVRLTIEGHCDEWGTNEYNMALGERRAAEVMRYLAGLGVDEQKMRTISYGEERPLDPGHNEEAWAKNRRARFVVELQK
ncbi:MAG: peptidoglycan-associated lipoprotein Pal [Smithellaceae bacterium]|nr:peptidoglycan-associated lipoprotein Pal [Smithellaceae bacterium]